MRYLFGFLTLACILGCQGSRDAARDASSARTTAVSSASDSDEELHCHRDTTIRRTDPGKLVHEFLSRDGAGEFLSASPFRLSSTDCTGEGTDYARVISSYSIDSLGIKGDTARFRVTYHFLGDLMQGKRGFDPRVEIVTDTFVVVRFPWSWRLVGDHDVPTLLRDVAKDRWQLTLEDRTRLDSAARVSAARVAPN